MNVDSIVKNTDASMKMEGLCLSAGERESIKKCLEGKKSFNKAVQDIVKQYAKPVKAYA